MTGTKLVKLLGKKYRWVQGWDKISYIRTSSVNPAPLPTTAIPKFDSKLQFRDAAFPSL